MTLESNGLYQLERGGGWVRVSFYDRPGLGGAGLENLALLQELLDHLARHEYPVVGLVLPGHSLASKLLVAVREAERRLADDPGGEPLLPLIREENGFSQLVRSLRELPSLIVGAVGGEVDFSFLGMLLACDYRIAAEDAQFVNQWLRAGEPPLGGAVWFLARSLGLGRASSLLLESASLTATEARRLGLVQRCVGAAELSAACTEALERFAGLPRGAPAAMKRALTAASLGLEPYLEVEAHLLERAIRSRVDPEEREGRGRR